MKCNKAIKINTLPLTKSKLRSLGECRESYSGVVVELYNVLQHEALTQTQLHHKTYTDLRKSTGLPSQLIISARCYAFQRRKHNCPKHVMVRFDKRLFSLKSTSVGTPVISVRTNAKRIYIPVKHDGAWKRIQSHVNSGWNITSIILTKSLRFQAILSREVVAPNPLPNVMGIDVNSSNISITIKNPRTQRIIKQLYLGRDVAHRQRQFERRRSVLRTLRDTVSPQKAGKKLKAMARKQRSFVNAVCIRLYLILSR